MTTAVETLTFPLFATPGGFDDDPEPEYDPEAVIATEAKMPYDGQFIELDVPKPTDVPSPEEPESIPVDDPADGRFRAKREELIMRRAQADAARAEHQGRIKDIVYPAIGTVLVTAGVTTLWLTHHLPGVSTSAKPVSASTSMSAQQK